MPARKGLLAPQNTFLDTIATRFDGTHGFCDLTGYSRAQIMQKSCACNFLYGQKTDVQHREAITRALEQKKELKLEVILYKSSGTPFWCLLDIVPIQDEKHEVVLFLCSHKDITKQKLHEQQQHQLAQLHAQKQHQHQRLQQQQHHQNQDNFQAQSATAASAASNQHQTVTGKPTDNQQQESKLPDGDTRLSDDRLSAPSEYPRRESILNRKLEDADEAELTAMANQNALLSMDEFNLQDDSGGEGEFEDGGSDSGEDHDKHTASQYSRRRSRAVLYQLSGHYGYRRSVNMKSKLKPYNRMNIPEYKTTTIEKQRFILSHYGVGRSCWDWLILVVSFYVAIVIPYNATFKEKQQDLTGECRIDTIDILVELVFLIDVLLNFRTTFVNRKGEVVTRPEIICRHYVRGWFVVDACAALPFDLLCSINLYSRSRLDLNLLKLIRLLRLARLLQKMDRYSQYSYIILTLLMLIFSLLAHWCACIWYVIAMEEIERNPPDWKIGWLHQLSDKIGYSVVNATDMASSYVTALYFTTSSLTSVGFGNVSANTNAEKIFSIVIMLIGALMHAVVFGNVTALIRVMYARRSNYQTRLRDLKDFFRLHQLPKELQQRMSDYFQTTWSLNHGIETLEILKDFPEELRGDVSLHLHREVLSLPIFETAPQGFLKSLARHIESKFCCPTEYLIHRGDALNYLYLVCNGSMEVLQDNMVVAILGKGDLVGYDVNAVTMTPEHTQYTLSGLNAASSNNGLHHASGLGSQKHSGTLMGSTGLTLVKSSSDLKALTYCDLKCIQIAGLLEVLKLYAEFSDTFHREIIHDLTFNLRENHDIDHENNYMGPDDAMDESHESIQNGSGGNNQLNNNNNNNNIKTDSNNNNNFRGRRSNMNQLFRSIESHQIGRYDHEHDDESIEGDDDNEEQDEDEEEEEEEVEEEEEEEEEGDEDDNDDNDNDESGGGGVSGAKNQSNNHHSRENHPGNDPSGSHTGGSSGSRQQTNGGERPEVGPQRSNSTGKGISDRVSSSDSMKNQPLATNENLRRGNEEERLQLIEQIRQRRMKRVGGDSSVADWHSYDGSRIEQQETVSQRPRNVRLKMMAKNISEDATSKDSGQQQFRTLSSSNNNNNNNLASSTSICNGKRTGDRKPPIMFDLSRNTTAIVDRRRRSAGCITRPLLIGPATVRPKANHSSLTHISENLASNQSRRQQQQQRGTSMVNLEPSGKSFSNQDLKNIDSRINYLSTSVRELKSELQQELSRVRGTMKLFIQLVERQHQQEQRSHLQVNDNSGVPTELVSSSGSLNGKSEQRADDINIMSNGRTLQQKSRAKDRSDIDMNSTIPSLYRSQSATSLPVGWIKLNTFATATGTQLMPDSRQSVLHEESDSNLSAGDHESIASEPVITEINSIAPEVDRINSLMEPIGERRAISQCSESSAPPSSAQGISGQRSAQVVNCLNPSSSDNDSGRSSTSMNSSNHHTNPSHKVSLSAITNRRVVMAQQSSVESSLNSIKYHGQAEPGIAPMSHQAMTKLENGKVTCRIMLTGNGSSQQTKQRYTTGFDAESEPHSLSGKSSVV